MLLTAKLSRIGRPVSIARGNKIGDHATHIALLSGVIVGPRMVACDSHRPCFMAAMQIAQEAGRILHVASWIEHRLYRAEVLAVEVLVDLHAADVDEHRAPFPRPLETVESFVQVFEIIGLSFDVHREWREAALPARLGQPNRIENALWNTILGSGSANCALTRAETGLRLRRKADQGDRRDCRKR